MILNNASRVIRRWKLCEHLFIAKRSKPISALHIPKLFLENNHPSLVIKRTFKIMDCSGQGCGIDLSKEALKKRLTSIQYQVTQEKDTERAGTGKYYDHFEKGTYTCVVCSQDIFSSEAKFDSKCGWPAFSDVVDNNNVKLKTDLSHVSCNLLLLTMKTDMKRLEVTCSKCGAHLGHVFDDGPKPTGKRYCINSAALDFRKAEDTVPDSASKS